MVNFKKMDEEDFVFLNEAWTESEKQAFSTFLKARKTKQEQVHKAVVRSKSKKQQTGEPV